MQIDPELVKDLKKADLRYVHDSTAGISRKKQNDTFTYSDPTGNIILSEIVLTRIKALSIPPAWSDVWICPSPSGYLQATGFDEKNRKQYLYHTDWIKHSQENKFSKMISFGDVLPKIRDKIKKDMAIESPDRNKIIATVIWLLEHTLIRVGNSEYAQENKSYGLTTLRDRHVRVRGKYVRFEFRGKSGIQQSVSISHPRIVKIIKECMEIPGYEIFQYLDEKNDKRTIDSSDVNEYLQTLTDEEITAKDFRTWGGTVYCAAMLHTIGSFKKDHEIRLNISKAVRKVSQILHNTAAVSREYYIHPTVFKTYQKNLLIPHFDKVYSNYSRENYSLAREEYATHSLLRKYS